MFRTPGQHQRRQHFAIGRPALIRLPPPRASGRAASLRAAAPAARSPVETAPLSDQPAPRPRKPAEARRNTQGRLSLTQHQQQRPSAKTIGGERKFSCRHHSQFLRPCTRGKVFSFQRRTRSTETRPGNREWTRVDANKRGWPCGGAAPSARATRAGAFSVTAARPAQYCSLKLKRANVWSAAKVSWLRSAILPAGCRPGAGRRRRRDPRPMRAPRDLSRCVPSSARPARSGLPGYGGASRPPCLASRGAPWRPAIRFSPRPSTFRHCSRAEPAATSITCTPLSRRRRNPLRPPLRDPIRGGHWNPQDGCSRPGCLGRISCSYAKISLTTFAGSTPVSRWSRPWNLNVNRAWSMPRQCRMVAFRSLTWTGFSTTL